MIPGFLIIYAKFSDIFGRKIMLLSALLLFTVFSSACGTAQTLLQLCVQESLETLRLLTGYQQDLSSHSGYWRIWNLFDGNGNRSRDGSCCKVWDVYGDTRIHLRPRQYYRAYSRWCHH